MTLDDRLKRIVKKNKLDRQGVSVGDLKTELVNIIQGTYTGGNKHEVSLGINGSKKKSKYILYDSHQLNEAYTSSGRGQYRVVFTPQHDFVGYVRHRDRKTYTSLKG